MRATVENVEKFESYYDKTKSLRDNIKILKNIGLELSIRTVARWREAFIDGGPEEVSIVIPKELLGDVKKLVEQYNKNNK